MPDSYPKDISGQLERGQQFSNKLGNWLVVELPKACQRNSNPGSKPKSFDMKIDLIYKHAFCGCMFCRLLLVLYFAPPIWCTKGGAYKHACILAASQCLGGHREYFHLCQCT